MSDVIDTKVVEMQFDNRDFEKNIKTSMDSLEQLKKSLDLEGAAKGFGEIDKAAKQLDLSGMASGIDTISKRFSTMGIVGTTILQRITNATINAAKKIAANFPPESVVSGFQEYETQIDAVQTILANTSSHFDELGYSQQERLDVINTKLDELNHYADKTIYNFTQMTRNIGTFTAAGIQLDVAVDSIQGIANLAAVSGSTSQQASTAMYQLSQALASGTVKLMDWNSVVNAGMGGKTFQDALMRTASVMGVVGKDAQEMFAKLQAGQVSFRDSLSSGWLSSDILTATLQQISWDFEEIARSQGLTGTREELIAMGREFKKAEMLAKGYTEAQIEAILNLAQTASDAATKVKTFTQLKDTLKEAMQSGWTQSWEYIIGDFDEAKELWTGFSDFFSKIIEASSEARNAVLKEWHDLGGRDLLFNNDENKGPLGAVWNVIRGIDNIAGKVKGAFSGLLPKREENALFLITTKIQEITASFYDWTRGETIFDTFGKRFSNMGASVDQVMGSLRAAYDWATKLFVRTEGKDGEQISGLRVFYENIRDGLRNSERLRGVLEGLGEKTQWVRERFSELSAVIRISFQKHFGDLEKPKLLSDLQERFQIFFARFPQFTDRMRTLGAAFRDFFRGGESFQEKWTRIKTVFRELGGETRGFGKGLLSQNTLQNLRVKLSEWASLLGLDFMSFLNRIRDGWGNVQSYLRRLFGETIPGLFKNSIGDPKLLTASIKDSAVGVFGDDFITFLSTIREKLSAGWGNFSGFVSKLFGETIPNILESKGFENLLKFIINMKWLTAAGGIWSLGSGLRKVGKGFLGIGESVKGIGSSVTTIAESIKTVGGGVGNIGDAIKDVVKKGITITQRRKTEALGTTILKIAAAIGVLVGSLWVLSQMKEDEILHGLEVIGVLAAGLLAVAGTFKMIHIDGKPLLQLAESTLLLALSVRMLSKMQWADMAKGLMGLGVMLLELGVFMRLAGKGFAGKTAFVGLAVGVGVLVLAMKSIAKLDWSAIGKGLTGLGAILLELALFMRLAGNGFANKTAFLGIAVAVNLLVIAVKQIGGLDTASLTKGLTGIGLLLLELGLFMKLTNKGFANKTAFLGIGIAVELLVLAVKQIGNMETGNLVKGLVGIGVMLTMLGGFLKKTGSITKIGGMIGMAIAVNLLVRAIQKLGRMKTGNLIKGVLALGGIMAAFGFLAKAANGMKFGSMITSLLLFAGTMGLLFAAFEYYGKQEDMDAMLKFSTSIAEILVGLSVAMKIISTIPITGALRGLGSFAIMVTGLGAIIIALGYLKEQWSGMTGFLESGGDVLGGIGLAIGKFVGGIASGFMGAAFDLPQLGKDLSAFMENASGFVTDAKKIDPTIAGNMAALAGAVIAIGTAEFINAIYGLFGDKTPVTGYCDDLVMLGGALDKFALSIEDVDKTRVSNACDGLLALSGALIAIGTGEFVNAILGLFGDKTPVTGFCDDIVALGTALSGFSDSISGIDGYDQNKINAAIGIASALAEIESALEAQGGLADKFAGVKSLAVFGGELPTFAEGLNAFSTELNKISFTEQDLENFPILVEMATSLAELEKNLEAQGGLTDKFEGTKSLFAFGNEIPAFGEGLNGFVSELKKISFTTADTDNFPILITMATSLAELEKGLEAQGGLADSFEGVKSLAVFGGEMPTFGEGLNAFLTEVRQIEYDETSDRAHLDGVLAVAAALNEFETTLNKQGGAYQWLVGEQNIGTFGDNLASLGTGLATFAGNLGSVDVDKTSTALDVLEMVQTFVGGLDETGGLLDNISSWFSGDKWKNLTTLTGNMATLGTDLITFGSGLNNIEESKSKFESATELFAAFEAFVAIADTDHVYSIFDLDPIEAMLNGLANLDIPEFNLEGLTAATTFLNTLKDGIQNGEDGLTVVIIDLSLVLTTALDRTYSYWYESGQYLGSGLGAGIASMESVVRASAVYIANIAVRAVRSVWAVHSPSVVGENLGMNFDLGLAGGIDGYAKVVGDRAENMAKNAVESAKTLLLKDGSSLFDHIDPNPTIRPVLDLSSVRDGAGKIAALFNSNSMINAGMFRSFNFTKGVGALNFDGDKIAGGIDNRDVVSEIQVLGDRIDALGETIAKMKVVLDSGPLVGGISTQMDNQLGVLAVRKGRAN